MTQYSEHLNTIAAFPPIAMNNTLGELAAKHGLTQLRIAETEKYAHVTFFFNGGQEAVFSGEERLLIPSPHVATYDLQPQMSALELTEKLKAAILSQHYDLLICNYANADMVGHTGNFEATVQAIECLDSCLHTISQAVSTVGGKMLITADHGNAELMFDPNTKQAHTAHTNLPVPLVFVGGGWHFKAQSASLIDIAPTILALLGLPKPKEMTGQNLLVSDHVD